MHYNEAHTPSISLVYKHQPSTNLDKNQAKTPNSNTQSSKYSIELTYTENKNDEASQEINKQATIKALQDKFQAIKELIARDKDGDYIDDERLAKFNELEKELKQFNSNEIGKSYIPIAKFKEFYEGLQDFCFGEIELKKSDSIGLYNHNQANIRLLNEKFEEFEACFLSEKNQSKFTELKKEWESLKEKWKRSFGDTSDAKFTMMQKFYASLQELLFPKDEFEKQILRYESSKCPVKSAIDKDFETRFGIKANPQIFFTNQRGLKIAIYPRLQMSLKIQYFSKAFVLLCKMTNGNTYSSNTTKKINPLKEGSLKRKSTNAFKRLSPSVLTSFMAKKMKLTALICV